MLDPAVTNVEIRMSEYTGNGTQKDLGKLEARQDAVETRLATIERNVEQILLYVTTIKGLSHILIGKEQSQRLPWRQSSW
jgi:hypothetical protein